jgi:hypothetical protein
MADEQQPKLQFLVYIIESPSAPDLYHGRSEGALLAQAAALDEVPSVIRIAVTRDAFVAALRIGLPDAMSAYPTRLPIVHISAHGAQSGLQLSNGDVITWPQLRELLLPVNKSLGGHLFLCMSACEGYSACQMAMELEGGEHPYVALIGNFGKPTWSETAVAYAALYHLVSRGTLFPDAVEAMKVASGNVDWILESAEQAQTAYAEYVKTVNLSEVRERLEAAADAPDVPEGAKALEGGVAG